MPAASILIALCVTDRTISDVDCFANGAFEDLDDDVLVVVEFYPKAGNGGGTSALPGAGHGDGEGGGDRKKMSRLHGQLEARVHRIDADR